MAAQRTGQRWHPAAANARVGVSPVAAPAGDRLRAMEQLESRALGKPTERIETETGETPAQRMLRQMSVEQLEALVQRRAHLQAVTQRCGAILAAGPRRLAA
jgi:hypothetical protein